MTASPNFPSATPLSPLDLGPDTSNGRSRTLTPLDPSHAARLGEAFAAMPPWRDHPYTAAVLAAYLGALEPDAPRYAILVDGDIAGALGLRLNWLRGPYVQFLGILAPFQGRGLGSAVLEGIETRARSEGQRNLWVAASDFNVAALRFYRRLGFSEVARLDDLVSLGRTELLLRKKLP